jgi:hypothetical protein
MTRHRRTSALSADDATYVFVGGTAIALISAERQLQRVVQSSSSKTGKKKKG